MQVCTVIGAVIARRKHQGDLAMTNLESVELIFGGEGVRDGLDVVEGVELEDGG